MRSDFNWPEGTQGAVSLTYDDGLSNHTADVAPLLQAHGLRGTFYVPIYGTQRGALLSDPQGWRTVAKQGHELGNHSIFHPCRNERKDSTWIERAYDLCHYDRVRIRGELEVANGVLQLIDGLNTRTYGNTCHQYTVGTGTEEASFEDILSELFPAARGTCSRRSIDPRHANFASLGCTNGDGRNFDDLREELLRAVTAGHWLIFCFHGVGEGTHNLYSPRSEHERLIAFLAQEKARIWCRPVVEVVEFLKAEAT